MTEGGWPELKPDDRIGAVYDFVRNEIAFGYNEGDELPASRVLADGIGPFFEPEPGTVLAGLLRKIDREAEITALTVKGDG